MNELRYGFSMAEDGLGLYLAGIRRTTSSGEEFVKMREPVARYDGGQIPTHLLPKVIEDLVRADCRGRYLPSEGRYVAVGEKHEITFSGKVEANDWWKNPLVIQELIYSRAKELGKEVHVMVVPKEIADKIHAVGIDEKRNVKMIL